MQITQGGEGGVVEVASKHERCDDHRQPAFVLGLRRVRGLAGVGDDARLQPGKAFPLSPLRVEILLEHSKRCDQRPGIPVGTQAGVDSKDESVGRQIGKQLDHPARGLMHPLA